MEFLVSKLQQNPPTEYKFDIFLWSQFLAKWLWTLIALRICPHSRLYCMYMHFVWKYLSVDQWFWRVGNMKCTSNNLGRRYATTPTKHVRQFLKTLQVFFQNPVSVLLGWKFLSVWSVKTLEFRPEANRRDERRGLFMRNDDHIGSDDICVSHLVLFWCRHFTWHASMSKVEQACWIYMLEKQWEM